MSYGKGLGEAIGCVIVMTIGITALVMGIIWYSTSDNTIKTDKLITPEIRLEIKNNKVDTLYVYKVK